MQTLWRTSAACLCLASLVPLVSGCGGPDGPPTYPIQGKIVFERGGTVQSLHDHQGFIEFESLDDPGVRAFGEILADGSFTLSCVKDGQPIAGYSTMAGNYRGRFNLDQEVRDLVAPQFLDFEKSGIQLLVPMQGEFVVKVWR